MSTSAVRRLVDRRGSWRRGAARRRSIRGARRGICFCRGWLL